MFDKFLLFNGLFRYFWKLVVEPAKKLGIVLIGMNDPFAHVADIFCQNYYLDHAFLRNKKGEIFGGTLKGGYMYACNVDEIYNNVVGLNEIPLQKGQYSGKIEVQDLGGKNVQITGALWG